MNKKSEKQSRMDKKIYNTPKLSVHGGLSEITKGGGDSPSSDDIYQLCPGPSI